MIFINIRSIAMKQSFISRHFIIFIVLSVITTSYFIILYEEVSLLWFIALLYTMGCLSIVQSGRNDVLWCGMVSCFDIYMHYYFLLLDLLLLDLFVFITQCSKLHHTFASCNLSLLTCTVVVIVCSTHACNRGVGRGGGKEWTESVGARSTPSRQTDTKQ